MERSIRHARLPDAPAENPSISRARELVLALGWNSTSFQIVNPGIKRWFSKAADAVVGFVPAAGFRVVVGAPVCAEERLPDVALEFEDDARRDGMRVCYFCAEDRLESTFKHAPDHSKFLLGAQPSWQPAEWPEIIRGHKSLRAQLSRALNKGVAVSEWPSESAANHPELAMCLHQWLESKGLPPLHFMVEPEILSRLDHRRIFVAERGSEVLGFIILSPVGSRNGWLFEQFPHKPGAPNGTVELMIDTAMRELAADGCEYATLGLSPLSTRAEVAPFHNPLWLRILLTWLRKHGKRFYNFEGLDAFKAKLQPQRWEPVFAICDQSHVSFRSLYAIASAFSGNAPIRLLIGGLGKALEAEYDRARGFISDKNSSLSTFKSR